MRWDTSKAHNMHRARAEQKDCTYRAHAGVRGFMLELDATASSTRHGFQQPVNMHNTQHTDNRGFQIGCNADSSARRSSRGKADSSARRSCCPARRAVLRGHQRNVHQRHPHNTAVQCEWCTAWHAALLCSFRTLALTTAAARSGTQLDPWPVGAAPDTESS